MVLAASFFSPEDFLYPEIVSQAEFDWSILTLLEKKLSSHTFSGILGHLESGVYLKNAETIEIQEGAYVESGAYICGPCIIGPYTQVRHGAYIRGGVITGAHSVVGHCSEIKNSYLGHHVKAAHFAYVGDSVLGARVNLGAGVRCANFRLDGKTVFFRYSGERYDTQRKKLGAFLGRGVSVGCNTVLNPGCSVVSTTKILPNQTVD